MSFWDNIKKISPSYPEDEFEEYDDESDFAPAQEEPRGPRRPVQEPAPQPAPQQPVTGSKVISMNATKGSLVLFRPNSYKDATKAADNLRDKKVVIVNLENADEAMACRVVDFMSGCAYALNGKARKIANATYLFAPHETDVAGDLENVLADADSLV